MQRQTRLFTDSDFFQEQKPVITTKCIETMLPIVADSWAHLRKCDVYQLLDSIAYESAASVKQAGNVIIDQRPARRLSQFRVWF